MVALAAAVPGRPTAADAPRREAVVVLHGLARSPVGMRPLARRLERAGYEVYNVSYPSRRRPIEQLVTRLAVAVQGCCSDAPTVHFVTHSLGGILVRAYLVDHELDTLGRVVMLAPPNHGSEVIDELAQWLLLRAFFGPIWPQLGTGETSLPNSLGPAAFEVGIIAGTRVINPLGQMYIDGANDGAVSVESAKLRGMRDFIVVPHTHTFIMRSTTVADEAVHFLRSGRFSDEATRPADEPSAASDDASGDVAPSPAETAD